METRWAEGEIMKIYLSPAEIGFNFYFNHDTQRSEKSNKRRGQHDRFNFERNVIKRTQGAFATLATVHL